MSRFRFITFPMKGLLVTVLSLGGATTGAVLLYRDFEYGGTGGSGNVVATLEKREAKVRRKPASSYIWQNIEESAPLYLKESVQTGPESAALVRLQDGSLLELGENSLVVIDKTAQLSLNYLKGSIILRDSTGDKQVTASATGTAEIRQLDVRLVRPEPLAHYFADERTDTELSFEWESKSGNLAALEISPDRGFKSSRVKRFKPEQGSIVAVKGLSPGQHFWRVISPSGEASQIRNFKISVAAGLVPVWPTKNERLRSFGEKSPIQFRWQSARIAESDLARHELEIAADPQFSRVLSLQSISPASGIAAVSGLQSGTLYWRLRSHFGSLEKISAPESFVNEHTDKVDVTLLGPARDAALSLQPLLRFIWSGGENPDLSYSWEIESKEGAPVVKAQGVATAAVWKSPRAGSFRWRVSALWNNRAVGVTDWSPLVISEGDPVTLVAPAESREIRFWDKAPAFTFNWKEDALVQQGYSYEFQVATEHEFRNPLITRKTAVPSLPGTTIAGHEGNLFWRVRVLDANGRPVKTSAPRSLRFGKFPLLAAPSVLPSQTKFNARDDEKAPILEWKPIDSAKSYEVTFSAVADANGDRRPANASDIVKITTETSLPLPELPEGRYEWRVRAIDAVERRGDASPAVTMDVTMGPPLPAPKVISSEMQ